MYYSFPTDPGTTAEANCSDGDIRLAGGSNPLEGRVEICFNRAWGTVCSKGFGEGEAQVVCNLVDTITGSTHNKSIPLRDAEFGEGEGPIFLENLGCNGSESQLVGSDGCFLESAVGIHTCDHSEDAGVMCTGTYIVTVYNILMYAYVYASIVYLNWMWCFKEVS